MAADRVVTAIVAAGPTGLIGDGLAMPWHLPRDLKRFRTLTMGKPLILGRKTHQALGRPLPGRLNIVLTRDRAFEAPGCRVAGSVDEALTLADDHLAATGGREVMVIGGAVVYGATLPLCDRLLLTIIEGDFAGNTFFPIAQADAIPWHLAAEERHAADGKNPHPHTFLTLDRQADGGADRFRLADHLGARSTPG